MASILLEIGAREDPCEFPLEQVEKANLKFEW